MGKLHVGFLVVLASATSCVSREGEDNVLGRHYMHPYGVEVPRYHWEESGQNGQVIKKLSDGITVAQSYYCGMLEGETSYTFPNSHLIEKVQVYSQDQLIKETSYYLSGKARLELSYHPSEPTMRREWYENGQLRSLEKISGDLLVYGEYYDMGGHRLSNIQEGTGQRTVRDDYGMMVMADTFNEGKVDYRTTYYPNGSPKEITPYKNGVVEGLRKTYHAGGEPNTIETWIGGRQEGVTTIFSEGQKAQEVPYMAGLKNGQGKIFKDGAIVIQEPTWKDDQLHGPCMTLIDGRKVTEWYYKGKKVTKGYFDSFTQLTPIDYQN